MRRPLVLFVLILSFVIGVRVFPQILTVPAGWFGNYIASNIKSVVPTPTPRPKLTPHPKLTPDQKPSWS